mmetsp:Transcript_108783/g.152069  ORF Transcript_108783/g.152069 Transcript_108783/m.152069 type:complete len:228 (+) Transcript_108783:392-1075(+)
MLDLCCSKILKAFLVTHFGETSRVKETQRFHGTHLLGRVEGWWFWRLIFCFCTQRGCCVEAPVAPSRASQTVLEKHANNRHHGKSSIGQLGSKFTLACLRVLDLTQEVGESNTIVAWLTSLSRVLHAELTLTRTTSSSGGRRLEESSCLNQTGEGDDLSTTKHWQLRQSSKAVWHICKLQSKRWRKVSWELVVLRYDVANCGIHGNAAMLDLHCTSALEGCLILVCA